MRVLGMTLGLVVAVSASRRGSSQAIEAPAGFDARTNGLVDQATYDADAEVFAEQEFVEDGLGPVFNAQACGDCHQTPVLGAGSQITELRAGRYERRRFTEHAGGSPTRNKLRTPPLWGLRTRNRFMHDGASLTFTDAIRRHQREARTVTRTFEGLSAAERDQLLSFLRSL